ncbi:hypothetical protein B0J18DRAFT_140498 [Chaetomium sp. MPI-SDFR-AT-0129]|nr:hypothetical protein B0J18DRAFT_140498 [Chaetomium sp. MPI-SDFR-AT-0129]
MEMPNKPAAPRPTVSESADIDAAGVASAELAPSCRPGDQEDRSPPPPSPTPHGHEPHPLLTSSSFSSSPSSTSPLPGQPSPTAGPSLAETTSSSKPGQTSLPTSFPPIFFQSSKVPSASLAPSTAEGKPVRLADPADTRHTGSALQKLNSKYPSAAVRRHGYAPEASSAQSSTYSQPVLVRTYSGPSPSQGSRSTRSRQYRPPSSNRGTSRRVPLPSASTPGSGGPGRPAQPTLTDVGVGTTSNISASISKRGNVNINTNSNDPAYNNNASPVNMSKPYKAEKATTTATSTSTTTGSRISLAWPWPLSTRREPEEPKLPPLDAFSFKSFMADLETRGSDSDIGADLDRIAEICARSRYSLSNQYEVHVAPHGSGASFTSSPLPPSVSRTRDAQSGHHRNRSSGSVASTGGGPTLQAITSDDENPARLHSRRRAGTKRRSAAYGTLETIMSSSRSSEEDKSKKKSAAELVTEVRGRAARKTWDTNPSASTSGSVAVSALESTSTKNSSNNSSASPDATAEQQQQGQQPPTSTSSITDATRLLARKKSATFANASISPSSVSASSSSHRNRRPGNNKDDRGKQKTTATAENAASALVSSRQDDEGTTTTTGRVPQQELAAVQAGNINPHDTGENVAGRGSAGVGNASGQSSWGAWIPWRSGQQEQMQARRVVGSHAEGSLRQLLRTRGD